MNPKESWVFEFVFELVIDIIVGVFVFFMAYPELGIFISLILGVSPGTLRRLNGKFIQRKIPDSKRYRLPLLKCDGVVVEIHVHRFATRYFLRECIVFNTTDGQQITAYINAAGQTRQRLYTINVGNTGTLHYRKDKKFNHYEEFYKSVPVFDDELEDDLED